MYWKKAKRLMSLNIKGQNLKMCAEECDEKFQWKEFAGGCELVHMFDEEEKKSVVDKEFKFKGVFSE